jgi:hypothetical protein
LKYVRGTLENEPGSRTIELVDVRSPKEFTGEILAPPEYPTEHAQTDTSLEQRTYPGVTLSMIMTGPSNQEMN